VFSSYALLPVSTASLNKSQAVAADKNALICLAFLIHNESNTCVASFQDSPNHSINLRNHSEASSSHNFPKSSAFIQATIANFSNSVHPFCTAVLISIKADCTAVPQASAVIPTEEKPADIPNNSAEVKLTISHDPAILVAKLTISCSVVAKLLPNSTY